MPGLEVAVGPFTAIARALWSPLLRATGYSDDPRVELAPFPYRPKEPEVDIAKLAATNFGYEHAKTARAAARARLRCSVDGTPTDPDSVSMRGLLEVIAPSANLITREEYLARAKPDRDPATELGRLELHDRRQILGERFDCLAGVRAAHLTDAAVRADLTRLDIAAAQVRDFVRKTIAHRDRRWTVTPPTWAELNAAIDILEQLVRRYNELLDTSHAPQLVPTYQYDWKAVFRIPWIDEK